MRCESKSYNKVLPHWPTHLPSRYVLRLSTTVAPRMHLCLMTVITAARSAPLHMLWPPPELLRILTPLLSFSDSGVNSKQVNLPQLSGRPTLPGRLHPARGPLLLHPLGARLLFHVRLGPVVLILALPPRDLASQSRLHAIVSLENNLLHRLISRVLLYLCRLFPPPSRRSPTFHLL